MTVLSGLLVILVLSVIAGCADNPAESEEPQPPPTLVGSWKWVNTTGPDTYMTPQSEGYRLTLIFHEDSTYIEFKDSAVINQGTFFVGDSTYWQEEWMRILTLEGYLTQKAFTFHTRDSLILSDYFQSNALVARYILDE
jgi:hypothetical protein